MKNYCDFCGEGFDYELRISTAKLPEGGNITVALCELCDEKYASDEPPNNSLQPTLSTARLNSNSYACS